MPVRWRILAFGRLENQGFPRSSGELCPVRAFRLRIGISRFHTARTGSGFVLL